MVEKYLFFGFDESNFASERKRLLDYLDSFGGGVNVQCLKEFPPCVLGEECDIKSVDKEIVLSDRDFLVNHNLFFGRDYVRINKRFRDSPFISSKCKQCEHFKSFHCRGLFNKKFLSVKDGIVKKRGEEQYNALMLEYFYGFSGFNSDCNFNCYFCGEELKDEQCYFAVVNPHLSIKEIIHFLHYLPPLGVVSTMFYAKCIPGELLMHKNIRKILRIVNFFVLKNADVVTNGYFLDDGLLDLISDLDYNIFLSIHSINKDIRKKIMGYKEDFDIKGLIKKILERNIPLTPCILALKENIINGDLKKTIIFLKECGVNPLIPANVCSLDWKKDKLENMNYSDEFLINYLNEEGLHDSVKLICDTTKKRLSDFTVFFRDYLSRLGSNNKMLLLAPRSSYKILKDSLKDFKNIHIEGLDNALRFNRTISCSLTVDVFLEALSRRDDNYDLLVIPRQSFDAFMNDIGGNNINELVSKVNKKVILVS